jgi:hypothetical protein
MNAPVQVMELEVRNAKKILQSLILEEEQQKSSSRKDPERHTKMRSLC